MAGFVGVCSTSIHESYATILEAAKLTVYSDITKVESLVDEPFLRASRSFVSFLEEGERHASSNDVEVWLDGEIFSQESSDRFCQDLLKHYQANMLSEFLVKVDGVFTVMICDRKKKLLSLITDRHGLRTFYFAHQNRNLMFAPEVKCFARLKTFKLNVRRDALQCLLDLEHFVGKMTWLEDVEAAEPATIIQFAWEENRLSQHRYWNWGMIKKSNLTFNDAAVRMGELLDATIKQRAKGNFRLGIGLSGGLDSRCLLAATHSIKPVTYTFGIEKSADVRIARQVAEVANVKHHTFDLKTDHWLEKRFSGVWKTDGMMNMYHMHYSHLLNEISKFMDVNLSGFLGDVVMGGSYLNKKGKTFLDQRITPEIAKHYYGKYAAFTDPSDSYFDIDKVDTYVMYNRGRRMIGLGAEEPNKTIPQRLPFMGNQLMEFCYSLPDEFRFESKLYNKALLMRYPVFYRDIPNASTGLPILEQPTLWSKVRKAYGFGVYAIKYKLGMATSYTDAYNWLKEPQTAALLRKVLDPKNALYSAYTEENLVLKFVEPHVKGKGNYMKQVMGALTVEVWLQQLLNGKCKA